MKDFVTSDYIIVTSGEPCLCFFTSDIFLQIVPDFSRQCPVFCRCLLKQDNQTLLVTEIGSSSPFCPS
jgi:hypothetical protein